MSYRYMNSVTEGRLCPPNQCSELQSPEPAGASVPKSRDWMLCPPQVFYEPSAQGLSQAEAVCVLVNWKWSGMNPDTVSNSFILCPFNYGHSPARILPGNVSAWTSMYHHGLQMVNPLPTLVWAGEDSGLRNIWICPVSSQPLKPDWQSPKSDHLLAPLDLPSFWLVMPLLRPIVNYLPGRSS